MTVPRKLSAFAAGVLIAFACGYGVGAALDPVLDDAEEQHAPAEEQHEFGEVHQP